MNETRQFLTHVVATIRYRANKSLLDAPASFASTRVSAESWDALHTVSHMSDVLTWCLSILSNAQAWETTKPSSLPEEISRFHAVLDAISAKLSSSDAIDVELTRIFQGPLADVLTHTGQLGTLRRLSGAPVSAENYFIAEI